MNAKTLFSLSLLVALSCGSSSIGKAVFSPDKKSTETTLAMTQESPTVVNKTKTQKPTEEKPLNNKDRKAYLASLNEARKRHAGKDYDGAIEAFDKALSLFPDDPRALNEKGWSEFFAKKLAEAEVDTRKALGRTTNKNLLGSSYCNLGRIQEEEGKIKEAIASYRQSLKERPGNKTVKERLAKLNAGLVERPAFAAAPLKAFASLDEFCKEHTSEAADSTEEPIPCDPMKEPKKNDEATPSGALGENGPYEDVRLFYYQPNSREAEYFVAIKTKDGWFVSNQVNGVYNPGAFGISESMTIDQFEFKDMIPGGAPEVILQMSHDRSDSDMGINEVESEAQTTLVVCGMGASGKPSCLEPVTLKKSGERGVLIQNDEEADAGIKHKGFFNFSWSLESTLGDGKLVIHGKPTKDMDEREKASMGTHAITFP